MTIIFTIKLNYHLIYTYSFNPKVIGAGDILGRVTNSWCSVGHIHVSMRANNSDEYIDPSRFKRKRKMPPPEWIETCDHYELVWLVSVIYISSQTSSLIWLLRSKVSVIWLYTLYSWYSLK